MLKDSYNLGHKQDTKMLSIPTASPWTLIILSFFKKNIKVILLMSDRQAYTSKESNSTKGAY